MRMFVAVIFVGCGELRALFENPLRSWLFVVLIVVLIFVLAQRVGHDGGMRPASASSPCLTFARLTR